MTLTCREITWKSDNPDAQLVRIRVGRCMAYDDHCMKWSRVQLRKTIGMEDGINVPVTMNLTEYRQCTSKLAI